MLHKMNQCLNFIHTNNQSSTSTAAIGKNNAFIFLFQIIRLLAEKVSIFLRTLTTILIYSNTFA